jgi:GNAT superfamily N-acetyltransferase
MLRILNRVRKGSPSVKDLRVFYITDGLEEPTVLSWGMVFQLLLNGEFILTMDVYTHPDHRRKGYGTMIAKAARQFYPTELIYAAVEWTMIYDRAGTFEDLEPLYAEDPIKS